MEDKDKIIQVSVEDILPNRFQPRLAFDEKELNDLSNSILKYGVILTIVLRNIGNKYEIIAGERRYKATVMAGLKTIPAIINNTDDNTSAEIALLENLQRKNLTVIEEAQSFKKLIDKGFTQEELANKLSISQSSIANKIRLLNLPKKVQDALLFNKISERHARSLLSLPDTETQLNLLDKIIDERLTVRQTEEEISKILNKHEEDIPEDIVKFINSRDEEKYKFEDNQFVKTTQEVPEVLKIEDNPEEGDINPFQFKFQQGIKRIQEELDEPQEESYYDKIIEDDFKNNRMSIENFYNRERTTNEELEEIKETKNKEDITSVVKKVRDLIKDFDKSKIQVKDEDLDNKYRIIIDIEKDI